MMELPSCSFTSVPAIWKQTLQSQQNKTQMVKRKQKLKIDGEIVREPQAAINDSRSPGPMNYSLGTGRPC